MQLIPLAIGSAMKLALTILLGIFAAIAFVFFVRSSMPTGTSFAPKNLSPAPQKESLLSQPETLVAFCSAAAQLRDAIT